MEVKDKTVTVPCEGLPEGTYALALFQDLNENGTLDTGTFGIPQEPTAFSNDAQGVMGPPSFEECSFTLRSDTTFLGETFDFSIPAIKLSIFGNYVPEAWYSYSQGLALSLPRLGSQPSKVRKSVSHALVV